MKIAKMIFYTGLVSMVVSSCSQNRKQQIENPVVQEWELITTLVVRAAETANPQRAHYFVYKVLNGTGGNHNEFQADKVKLKASTEYDIDIRVLDESDGPAKDVTPEIVTERNVHLFYYSSLPPAGSGSIATSHYDTDEHGQPFGRTCKWNTGSAGTGTMVIELIHGPRNKMATERAKIAGSTDVEATFDVELQ